ncbi:unnamed protein product [Prorocentrum cordatum]|uniref:Uncharacterized protein n=1 Tax=Prorocentrum cordatum TaxID=2364126 RepID=A0ABN9WPY0_9DINO|nr:unnamed protein product [Polarella glacialis]
MTNTSGRLRAVSLRARPLVGPWSGPPACAEPVLGGLLWSEEQSRERLRSRKGPAAAGTVQKPCASPRHGDWPAAATRAKKRGCRTGGAHVVRARAAPASNRGGCARAARARLGALSSALLGEPEGTRSAFGAVTDSGNVVFGR